MNFLRDALQWQTQVFAQLLEHIGPAPRLGVYSHLLRAFLSSESFCHHFPLRRNEIAVLSASARDRIKAGKER